MVKCPMCGREFEKKNSRHVYCSRKCFEKNRRNDPKRREYVRNYMRDWIVDRNSAITKSVVNAILSVNGSLDDDHHVDFIPKRVILVKGVNGNADKKIVAPPMNRIGTVRDSDLSVVYVNGIPRIKAAVKLQKEVYLMDKQSNLIDHTDFDLEEYKRVFVTADDILMRKQRDDIALAYYLNKIANVLKTIAEALNAIKDDVGDMKTKTGTKKSTRRTKKKSD